MVASMVTRGITKRDLARSDDALNLKVRSHVIAQVYPHV